MLSSKATATEKHGLPTPPNDSPPPPAYALAESNVDVPDITAAFSSLNLAPSVKPTPDVCIAHLKLLEAFHQLREDVTFEDGRFGINDAFADAGKSDQERAGLLTKIREKRWQVYVTKASKRFERWWTTCVEPIEERKRLLGRSKVTFVFSQGPDVGERLVWSKEYLPPLDVIMVWHAYMLNPRDFLEDCLRQGKMRFWRTGLPWAVIDPCINNNTFEYSASEAAMEYFEDRTGYRWDSLSDFPNATIECPSCRRTLYVPRTKWDSQRAWTRTSSLEDAELYGDSLATGFSDKKFEVQCQCGIVIDHELYRTQKFRKDILALRNLDVPMPGTILSDTGIVEIPVTLNRHPSFFPNRLIDGPSKLLYTTLEALTVPRGSPNKKMTDIRTEIERFLKNKAYIKITNHSTSHVLKRAEKIAVRRMMSRYWDNSSIFALDLVGAVIRQGSFIEKMHSIDWIHSPAATSTMARLIEKYTRYIYIISCHPLQTAVPTLDVDLAWHTHQLSPPSYYAYTVTKTARFIDHDDKIEETALSTAFEWTSKTYQKMYDDLYSECTCWYCEAIRESHTSSVKRVFGGNKAIESQLDRLHAGNKDPNTSPHISSHNAIKADKDVSRGIREANMKAKLERDYQKACNHARKKGRTPPTRDQYNGSGSLMAYGYPIYMPYYAPYMGDPCVNGGFYAANPACANFTAGAAGNCCAGACGGGVAAGSCGGGSFGGCAGGMAGGCGGSSGGGGGGGGCGGSGGGCGGSGGGCGGCGG